MPAAASAALLLLTGVPVRDVEELARELLPVFPQLDEDGRRIALTLYRQLAEGAPVALAGLAERLAMSAEELSVQLRGWPGVYYDERQRVIGFQGLTIRPMAHRLCVNGREVHAWCAWDTLFLPELLGATAAVQSTCRATGEAVKLTVTPRALERAAPAGTMISFLLPQAAAVREDVITSFCHYVHFFSSASAAQPWLAQRPELFALSLADAYALGRRINRARYGNLLG